MTTHIENIPPALAKLPIWLGFSLVDKGKGRLSKPPVSPRTGRICSKTDESEQVTLTEALEGVEAFGLEGVGIVLPEGIISVDLDSCFDDAGALTEVAQDVFDHLSGAVWEYSPSGNGLHGYMFATKPNRRCKDVASGIEVYDKPAFLTVTGDLVEGSATDLTDQQDAIEWLFETYLPPIVNPEMDTRPVEHGDRTPDEWLRWGLAHDEKLASLYNATSHDTDESSADFALMTKLAYWLNRDTEAMTSAFMSSPWARTKDAPHTAKIEKRGDYLRDSIAKAAALTTTTAYEGSRSNRLKAVRYFSASADEEDAEERYTDLGNAKIMSAVFGDVLTHTPEWGWCFFNGTRWETDVSHRAMTAAKDIAEGLMAAAEKRMSEAYAAVEAAGYEPDSKEGKEILKPAAALFAHAMKTQSEHGLTAMVTLNKSYMMSHASTFNTDPWLLNTPGGVIDLKSGEMMPHDAKYRLTTMTTVTPKSMPTPMFDGFLDKVFCGDSELIDFMQVAFGSALVGKVYTENLMIATGCGSNGKSTLFNTIQYILGDYATSIDPNLLMSSKANEQQVGMAMLQGRRFAVAQETEEGQRLSSSMLKRMVSTDTMVAKKLYKDPHEFTPSHMLVLSTNHLPKISSTDGGTWRRIVVVPFDAVIKPDEIITDFHSMLIEREGAGILEWAIRGAVKFSELNCDFPTKPAAVVRASSEYRTDEDRIARFLSECCIQGDRHDETMIVKHNDLYRVYAQWARTGGEFVLSTNLFGRALQTNGLLCQQQWHDPETNATTKVWNGLRLLNTIRQTNIVQGKGAAA